tara:strand:+ start:342 stop:563 length:222 start_codon:yes stop_codon:yes gene_type:complete
MSKEIDRWIEYMKNNPTIWKKKHTAFINAQFKKSYDFIERLLKEPKGEEKLFRLYNIKNRKGFSKLISKNKKS